MAYVGRMPESTTVLEGLRHIHQAGEAMMARASYAQHPIGLPDIARAPAGAP